MLYYSVRVSTRLVCSCNAYKFPHDPSKGLCSIEILDLSSVPTKASPRSLARAEELINKGYLG